MIEDVSGDLASFEAWLDGSGGKELLMQPPQECANGSCRGE
ncbi:hypothetical protein [Bosea sp. BIWAKO-01]|nr:hypothetical protein [Bosea sp. BIWAKO-01]